jgi:RNA polymerase sigma-70 factor (ECF subfamily)
MPREISQQCPDAELVRLLLDGDRDAMTVIFERYYRMVMSIALRMLRDVAEAEDVVQIVFTDFYQKAHLFDERKGNLGTWLLQYAYSRTINYRRGLKGRLAYDHIEIDEASPETLMGACSRVFDLETREAARLVEQILPSLSDKQRLVIERVFFEGMRVSEVASEIGDSVGNTQHAYYRGIEKLRQFVHETAGQAAKKERSSRKGFFSRPKRQSTASSLRGEVQIAKTRIL